MSEKTDYIHTYVFSWSGPFRLEEQEMRTLALKLSEVVADSVPYLGAASIKEEIESVKGARDE